MPKYTDANQTRKCIGALSHNHLYLWTKSQYPLECIGIGPTQPRICGIEPNEKCFCGIGHNMIWSLWKRSQYDFESVD